MNLDIGVLVPVRSGGSGGFVKHLLEVVPRWMCMDNVHRVALIMPEMMTDLFSNLDTEIITVKNSDHRLGFRQMKQAVYDHKFDVIFNATARPVNIKNVPVVTKVQNIEPLQKRIYSADTIWKLRLLYMRLEHLASCRMATRILAVSDYVKNVLRSRYNFNASKIDTVYHGYNASEKVIPKRPDIDIKSGEFIFCAGSIVPYRGYEDVIDAMKNIIEHIENPLKIVFAGKASRLSKSYERMLYNLSKKNKMTPFIVWAGHLSREEMAWCFQNSKLFVQTSRAEACPNIVIESMGNGCSTVSCNFQPMPEFYQDSALYYKVGNSRDLAEKINIMLNMTPEDLNQMKYKQKKIIAKFLWDQTAKLTMESLVRAIDEF